MYLKLIFIVLALLTFMEAQTSSIKIVKHNLQSIHQKDKSVQIPEKIFGAEIHFSRIPHQYWQHRLQMVKAMGFNALSVYIMWNHHEISRGMFDYENGDKNLKGFLTLAQKYNFTVLFRPGPYVCAEWDFGGLPARLLSIKGLEIRANNKAFLDEVKVYFASLVDILHQFSFTNKGPIIMLQIQNEYGWYGTDKSYMQAIRSLWKDLNVTDIPEYYVDWFENIEKCHWEGANIGINNGIVENQWVKTRQMEPKGYLLGGQIYSGWLTHWGEQWQGKSLADYTEEFRFLMENNHSFSMYMAHGGSNFALTAGANGFQNKPFDYGGHITSYDYDAPINEQGSPNNKYHIFRELAKKHATWQIPEIPSNLKTIAIPNFIPSGFADLLLNFPEPSFKGINELLTFEDERLSMWNQGFVAYETYLQPAEYEITLTVHDFALVYLNSQFVQAFDRGEKVSHTFKVDPSHFINRLIILVESMGHINFGSQMLTDYKGLINFTAKVTPHKKNGKSQQQGKKLTQSDFSWDIYKIPIDNSILSWKNKSPNSLFPRLYRYNLTLQQVGDTYFDMSNWQKGYIFVNGYNLGRYWNKGPQQKVFCPGVWLKKGVNDFVVMELLADKARFIKGDHNLMVGDEQIYHKKHNTTVDMEKDKKEEA